MFIISHALIRLRASSLEIRKDAVSMHSSSQTCAKEDDQSKHEQHRQKQRAFRKIETCRERSSSDNIVAEHPKLLKCFWWHGPTQGQSHWQLIIFLLFSTPKVMQPSGISHWTEQLFLFSFFVCFWFLKGDKIIWNCFSSLVTGDTGLETWAFSPGMYYYIWPFERVFVMK